MTTPHTAVVPYTGAVPADPMAEKINAAHDACVGAAREALRYAIMAGELLTEQKQALPHGAFTAWVKEHCRFGDRTAQLYMQLARHFGGPNPKRISGLTIQDALAEVRAAGKRLPRQGDKVVIEYDDPDGQLLHIAHRMGYTAWAEVLDLLLDHWWACPECAVFPGAGPR